MGADTSATAFTTSELVFLPPARVWALLTDWTAAAPAWMPGVTEMHAEGPLAPGLALDFHVQGHDRTSTVSAVDPGRSITISFGAGDVRTDYRYDLAEDGDDTRLTLTVDVVVSDRLAGLAGQIRDELAAADGQLLENFKRYAEKAP
ncbi:SRPBCC family protein [Arthrobacter mobilis]|uniref:SRPBCC family protein n=1 Tax=Arthrobacter mobilis TaxID=2724944 RepID=A0A7X6HF31_9MICC|nr:SRPBCC family protein [Arthrobacter mobilis]NKX54993.1 SRPBCC family protein [Arthrobacter mobilis]